MTIDHSSDFDARRVGRRQRRAAVRAIGRATALTAADRGLRVQQARAAHTRGELNALTRGLEATQAAPSQLPMAGPPMMVRPPGRATLPGAAASSPPPWQQAAPRPKQQPAARRRSISGKVLVGLVALVLTFGGSVVSCVSSMVDSVSDSSSDGSSGGSPSSPPDLTTDSGLRDMIDAYRDEVDTGDAVLLIVEPRSSVLSVATSGTRTTRYLYDGDVIRLSEAQGLPSELAFDLDDIDRDVVAVAVGRARRSSGVADADPRLQITGSASGPRTLVSFPDSTRPTYSLFVDHQGDVVYETD